MKKRLKILSPYCVSTSDQKRKISKEFLLIAETFNGYIYVRRELITNGEKNERRFNHHQLYRFDYRYGCFMCLGIVSNNGMVGMRKFTLYGGSLTMTKEIARGSLICPKRSTKHLIQGIIYKVVGQTLTGRYYAVRCPYEGTKHYVHKNNVRVMK